MQPFVQRILESLDDPKALEALYRQDPESFRDSFEEVARAAPDSMAVRVWQARLEYRPRARAVDTRRLWHAIGIALCVGALVRIPAVWLGEEWYYPRLGPSLVILALAAYFWIEERDRRAPVRRSQRSSRPTPLCSPQPRRHRVSPTPTPW